MELKKLITPEEVKALLPDAGGIGFIFHATDWNTLGFSFQQVPVRSPEIEEALWNYPPIIGSLIRVHDQVIGANIVSAVPAELWTQSTSTIRRFRSTQYDRCLQVAKKCGIRLVALGALTPYACDYGRAERHEETPAVTTGHAATAVTLRNTVLQICHRLSIDVSALRLAIIGAAGMMGQGTLIAFSTLPCQELILIDFEAKLPILKARRLHALSLPTTSLQKITLVPYKGGEPLPEFDGALLITNTTTPFLTAENLRRAKFWIDDSHPRAANLEAEQLTRRETYYVECYTRGPMGLDTGYPFRLPTSQDCYSCFAEGYVAWAEGYTRDFVTGPPSIEAISNVGKLLNKHGFAPGPLSGKDGTSVESI